MRTREKSKAQLLREVSELKAQVAKLEHQHRVAKHEWNRQMDQVNELLDRTKAEHETEVENLTKSLVAEREQIRKNHEHYEWEAREAGELYKREIGLVQDRVNELMQALMAQTLAAGTLAKHMGVKVRVRTCSISD